jgi:hypothetical protein
LKLHEEWAEKYEDEIDELKSVNRRNGEGRKGKGMRKGRKGDFHGKGMGKNDKRGELMRVFLYNGPESMDDAIMGVNSIQIMQGKPVSPNPFTEATKINFNLEKGGTVKITINNTQGSTIQTVHNGYLSAGEHEFNVDGSQFTSGTYIYKIETEDGIKTGKMVKR